ncbi:MAG TPA: IPT/TIG domain-containing protein [Thermoanaerobaculia bacterium]|nr:IPT/TIG domain-containing protein [Thermoanaerobaculia bacterium]
MPRLLALLLILTTPVVAQEEPPEMRIGENGCQGARVLEHLERHGDYGFIDSEALLYISRVEHERRVLDQRYGIGTEAIAGNVWTSIGPTNGAGRAVAIALHPTVIDTAIVGAAGGGAWRTTDRGVTWTPLTETIPNLSVGAVAYAPSNPTRVYLGTGEGGYAGDFIPGIGLLTSNDGGTTWNLPSSVLASMFYRIAVHPTDMDDIIVGTNRGALRSTSGPGGPWSTVIPSTQLLGQGFGDVTDLVRDPSNASVLYAATWDRGRWCARNSCTPAQNFMAPTVLKSTNGGATWAPAGLGLPVSSDAIRVERMSIAIAPSSPGTLYALTAIFNAESGATRSHVYKTTDGGNSWTETGLSSSDDPTVYDLLRTQGWYDNTIVVSPHDANVVIAGGVFYARTVDGGVTWHFPFTGAMPHVDVHDLRYDNAGTLWIANDGGVWTSNNDASTATPRNSGLVTRQYYAMSMDPVNRKRVLAGTQDNGTNMRTDVGGTSWSNFSGGDGFQCYVHAEAPGVALSTFQFAEVLRTKNASSAAPLISPSGPVFDEDERKPFFSILEVDPSSPSTLYLASTRVWKSTAAAESWVPLSTNMIAGGAWGEETIRAIAIAPSHSSTIMIAKGPRVLRTIDGGASWLVTNVGLPGRNVTNLAISPLNRDMAFATIAGTSGPSVFFTIDGGTSWTARANGLPSFSALVFRFDPTDPSTAYAGTDVGVYRSTDLGLNWSRFGTGMPAVSVYDLRILPDGSVFRAATHGRGIWELNVTGVTNRQPAVTISTPAASLSVARGSTLTFSGAASDADGDALSLQWTFPDDWSTKSGATSAQHTFDRAGIWPVSLTAQDGHGAIGGDEVVVTVTESSDNCATPLVVPAAGPFPWSVTLNSEVATAQSGSEPSTGGSCYPFRPLRTMWLSFTPAATDTYSFSLCTSRVAGFISAYSGPACGPHGALAMCLTNTELTGNCGDDPQTTLALTAGVEYRFFVGSYYSNSFGPITVTIERGTAVGAALRSVSPATGPIAGGTKVVLTGSGFTEGATVRFGGALATNVTVISPSVISATVPAHAAGNVDVSVRMGSKTSTSSKAFTYTGAPPQGKKRSVRH